MFLFFPNLKAFGLDKEALFFIIVYVFVLMEMKKNI